MENFDKEIYMKGCHLIVKLTSNPSNMYQFIFSESGEFTEVFNCSQIMEYELEDDGTYYIVTIQNDNAEVIDGKLKIGINLYDAEQLQNIIQSETQIINIGLYDFNQVLSICKLKQCLANLELKAFQDLLKNCGSIKCKNIEYRNQTDFLFIAVWLIEHYLILGNVEMARSVYEKIKSCGSICENLSNKNNCGCNG